MTSERRHFEFFVLSYVPQAVATATCNVGLVIVERNAGRTSLIDLRFIQDKKALLACDPHANLKLLTAIFSEIEHKLRDLKDSNDFLQMMLDSFSNAIQISDGETLLSGDPAVEIDKLAALYIPGFAFRG